MIITTTPSVEGRTITDYRGIDQYVRWIKREIAQRGIDRCVLVGHSMGGKLAMALACDEKPSEVEIESLKLIAPSPATREPMSDSDKHRLAHDHPSTIGARRMVDDSIGRPLDRSARQLAIETATAADGRAWQWWLFEGMENSIAADVSNIQAPVQVLASREDPVIPIDTIRRDVVEKIPTSHLDETSGVGHLMPLEDARMVAAWLIDDTSIDRGSHPATA